MDNLKELMERKIEGWIFASRWLLAPLYLILILALGGLVIRVGVEFVHFSMTLLSATDTENIVGILNLIDSVLLGNLLILVIFSGYENFVSIIDVAKQSEDRPKWMGEIDFAGLKLKLIGSIVAISSINLLGAFLDLTVHSTTELSWMLGIHVAFVVTGVLYALSERMFHPKH